MTLNESDIMNVEENGYMFKYEMCPYLLNIFVPLFSEDVCDEINRMIWNSTIQFHVDIAVLLDMDRDVL